MVSNGNSGPRIHAFGLESQLRFDLFGQFWFPLKGIEIYDYIERKGNGMDWNWLILGIWGKGEKLFGVRSLKKDHSGGVIFP